MDSKRLARVHRVRTLQLGLARADEARAWAALDSEAALSHRIRSLADRIAPASTEAPATNLAAAAYYRERLHRSAEQAANRVRTAETEADRSAAATRAAHRDQSAIEKLIARADAQAARDEMKALEDHPAGAATLRGKRHDPC